EKGVQGLVINVVSPLSSKEKDLIRDSFPSINFDKLLILEEGRTPTSALWSTSLIFGGIAVLLGGIGLLGLGFIGGISGKSASTAPSGRRLSGEIPYTLGGWKPPLQENTMRHLVPRLFCLGTQSARLCLATESATKVDLFRRTSFSCLFCGNFFFPL